METRAFKEELEKLVSSEDPIAVSRDVNTLQREFEDYILEQEHLAQVAQLEAEEKGETVESEIDTKALKDAFYEVYNAYRERKKKAIEERNAIQAENLRQKRGLLHQLRNLIDTEENIGTAFQTHKEINEKWKAIGDIAREKRQDIQQEYSRLLEEFFYNMNIYKQIKDYDFKRNLDLKEGVITKLKALENETSIKDLEANLKLLQNEWEDIGPTLQEEWERLKEVYYPLVKSLYDKIRAHYDERKEQMRENISAKRQLIEKAKEIVSESAKDVKEWNSLTDKLIQVQEDWKKIGFGPRKENEEVWKEFRGVCDAFFAKKSEFFKSVHSQWDEIAAKKEKLIAQVAELKTSTQWKETTSKIIQIQKRWKEVGHAGQRNEQRLWKQFRAEIDAFFAAKDAHFAELDKANEENLVKKEALIGEIKGYKPTDNKSEVLAQLKSFSERFAEIGHVPIKDKNRIYEAYKKAIDEHYSALKLEGQEKEKVMFEARLETLKSSPNASDLFYKEKQAIRNTIDEVKNTIVQYENNLGFFANSKGANSLKEEVERKITKEKEKLAALKAKLKMIPNE